MTPSRPSAVPDAPILVTGAAGKTGQAVIQALAATGATVRALVRRPEQATLVRKPGAAEVVIGDVEEQHTIAGAMEGVRAVYHICPNMHPHEIAIGDLMIELAKRSGIEHFAYHSVLHPQAESMPHHWAKLRVEERLFQSGIPFTILQPAAYMQNLLAQWERILGEGIYPVPYNAEARISLVDLADVGEAAAIVLTQPGHQYAIYELCGTLPLSQNEVAATIERQIGRDVRVQVMALFPWQEQARRSGLGDHQIDTLSAMFRYYDAFGLAGNSHVLGWLLGRPTTTLAAFIDLLSPLKRVRLLTTACCRRLRTPQPATLTSQHPVQAH
jgi:NAD(P)H dehydrogenase (quinone)